MQSPIILYAMSKTLSLTGNLQIQPTDASRPLPVPLMFTGLQYSQYSQQELVYSSAQSNVPLSDGTISAPKLVYIEVLTGSAAITTDSGGTHALTITANATPNPNEQAAFLLLYTYGANGTLYLTTTGPTQLRVWFFQ